MPIVRHRRVPMPPAPRVQPVLYLGLCLALLAVHEALFAHFGDGVVSARALALLALLLAAAAGAAWSVLPRLARIPAYRRRRDACLLFDFALYGAVALGLLAAARVAAVPAATAAGLALGVAVLGYFATVDNALARQLHWFRTGRIAVEGGFTPVPLARKFGLVLVLTVLVVALAVSLSAYRLLEGAPDPGRLELLPFRLLVEILFIFGVSLALLLRLVNSYTRNTHAFLQAQMAVMRDIQNGELDNRAPIMAQDELGLVAVQINAMIEHLRDRDRLHRTLERVVGANIMEKLLTTDDETLKRGQEDDVAIMFCDMRDFTSKSEISSTEELIRFLNSFFSDLSEIVSRHNGTINKFMGDAVLAVYGLDDDRQPVEDAVRSALEILAHTRQFVLPDGSHPDMGAGIHFGTVMAGTIGSEQRYEYTFLGDAVNTASRLEGLTKRLGFKVVISREAYAQLAGAEAFRFVDLGSRRVRGKTEPLHVYGTCPK